MSQSPSPEAVASGPQPVAGGDGDPFTDDTAYEERLSAFVGRVVVERRPGPDVVNLPMIRHWVDALDDRNPAYDETAAGATRFGEVVAPPAMLQTWTMGRPTIAGIAERGGAPGDVDADSPLAVMAAARVLYPKATHFGYATLIAAMTTAKF